MLHLFYSNRHETLADALLEDLAAFPAHNGPWASQQVIVPSAALRRRLELDIAARHGVCANVEFTYLAQWLWAQIGRVLTVPARSPFAPDRLVWRCYRLFAQAADGAPWFASPRLAAYLSASDDAMRYELAQRVATVLDHYLTYRPEWLAAWQAGESVLAGDAAPRGISDAARDDERWQAALWRALLAELSDSGTPPAHRFLVEARNLDAETVERAEWPESVCVFALPTMPPLHVALLRELSRWIDVRIYALNPCREFWFDIVTAAHAEALDAAGRLDYQEVGHPLLAEWGRQTQAQLHMLHELTESAASGDASRFVENAAPSWLARVQNAILGLQPEAELGDAPAERGIEVHVCHSLARQLEVLHDRLLAWFDADATLQPSDVLVAVADLAAAGPLIDAVFGTAGAGAARVPYRITGLPPSQANPVARVLLEWLALPDRQVGAPELVEWLRVDAVAARYGIDAAALETVQTWLAAAGARRGLSPAASDDAAVPAPRHTFADALARLFLGYAMPEGAAPIGAWLPIEAATGSEAELLGRLARFTDDLDGFAQRLAGALTPRAWSELFADTLARFFDSGAAYADALAGVRDALDAMLAAMTEGAPDEALPAAVVRAGLAAALDDPARGGVPWGGVTFSSLTSLRGLPYRVICLLGMDDGVLPSLARADEFDLMAVLPKLGDRQRRDDERNLFLDLLLAARDRLLIAYTGRSIRDNAPLPPAALVDELLDHLALVTAGADAAPDAVDAARRAFVVEHPLQPFAAEYFRPGSELASYDAERATLASLLAAEAARDASREQPFFAQPLAAEPVEPVAFGEFERFWRHPARALLRARLGIVLSDAQAELLDTEPFALDFAGSDALAERLLPLLIESDERDVHDHALRIADASPELPGGATGAVWRDQALGSMTQLASNVRRALAEGVARRPFTLTIAPAWPETADELFGVHDAMLSADAVSAPLELHGTLNRLTPAGQVIYRYARPSARDYLSAWLAHLVYCAVEPDGPRRSLWFGSGGAFELTPVAAPLERLAPLAALFRAGRRMPLRFFPRSAWACVSDGDAKAASVWINERVASEADDPAIAIAWRGAHPSLDEPFGTLARLVFEPMLEHLKELE
ncbi:exodeoxyribonuclease V subunit gamma [Burkholderia vietnamiensis]|uniref:exodeoxyribonuclease V subunit gamma n=1 Tax=Burkholderia vietnamiensis TaxID=60552 RepID=UPI000754C18D|nr:exodeoxyribonuclease V subunit gamma [Burkholderia vietnamiensis]KVR85339.1 exodeoxyribonuclease V subunit gamma [Burkholderia vietnamiensis]KVS47829.1 exodeoxyribonuclease V subunit gamma [Burkholderia vietnamiensis]MBR8147006.1 exodeoxyribonuclease V subunit gamma [Burkholderia vietnamiensis]